jgi:tetratricopeptide (TPR) repeat protein
MPFAQISEQPLSIVNESHSRVRIIMWIQPRGRVMRLTVLYILVMTLAACSSTTIITSDPAEVEVYLRRPNVDEKKALGTTPLELSGTQIAEKTNIRPSSGAYYEIIAEKKGYQPQRVLVPASRFNTSKTEVHLKLRPGEDAGLQASDIVEYLFNAQKFAQMKEFERAQMEVEKALKVNKKFIRAISMRGTIYYMQGRYNDSLQWFEKALELDPKFEDAVKMIAHIRKKAKVGR